MLQLMFGDGLELGDRVVVRRISRTVSRKWYRDAEFEDSISILMIGREERVMSGRGLIVGVSWS